MVTTPQAPLQSTENLKLFPRWHRDPTIVVRTVNSHFRNSFTALSGKELEAWNSLAACRWRETCVLCESESFEDNWNCQWWGDNSKLTIVIYKFPNLSLWQFRPSVMYHSHGTYQERKRVLKPKAKAKLVIAGPISSQAFRSVSVRTIRELFVFFWFALYGRTSGF